MSCWFGFPPPSCWAEHGLALRIDPDNAPVPLDEPAQEATVVDLVEPVAGATVATVREPRPGSIGHPPVAAAPSARRRRAR